eukprot:8775883-Ditylum_brightwellii.AAC.1
MDVDIIGLMEVENNETNATYHHTHTINQTTQEQFSNRTQALCTKDCWKLVYRSGLFAMMIALVTGGDTGIGRSIVMEITHL